jgi:transcription-repair coupling factor (superfamily II helicase)
MTLTLSPDQSITLTQVQRSATGYALRHIRKETEGSLIYVCASDRELASLTEQAAFFLPQETVLSLPAWDCLPYDRVSPHPDITAQRLHTLVSLAAQKPDPPIIVLTTINALLQKLPPRQAFAGAGFLLNTGSKFDRDGVMAYLTNHGYIRVEKAIEPGEFAVRGSIVDIVSPGMEEGIRLDLFGDEIESIRTFDVLSQRSVGDIKSWTLAPMSEIVFSKESIERFRTQYREQFGAVTKDDPLYEAISNGRFMAGMEHWLPLFYDKLENITHYVPNATLVYDYSIGALAEERIATIKDYYDARKAMADSKKSGAPAYHPLRPDALYLDATDFEMLKERVKKIELTAFAFTESKHAAQISLHTKQVPAFHTLKAQFPSVFDALKSHAADYAKAGKRLLIACFTSGSMDRVKTMLMEHDIAAVILEGWGHRLTLSANQIGLCVLPIEQGFDAPEDVIISEQDLFGERIFRSKSRRRKVENFLAEAANFLPGELVVHKEHGIAKFEGLHTLEVLGSKHDCLKLIYDGEDKLFIPVENIDLISRYGSDAEDGKLDKLGGVAWQSRKAKLKERIQLAAEALMKTAAERAIRTMDAMPTPEGLYDEFCARFPYMETEDQAKAIEEITEDLASGKPTDRLICGDVGFGKTEVALRAAFIATSNSTANGKVQVAVVCPTTLLCRQHVKTFTERFAGLPITIRQLSRMVSAKDAKQTQADIAEGKVDIVVGTHALLSESIKFKNLGLLIIDEEQHFGVAQKEKLKSLKGDVHVVTLSATPIPRTMQMALSGVRELSLITTPPVDRLAVRTFVTPFDPVVIREAIIREYHRGGKIFYVTPRVKYIAELQHEIASLVPEIKIGIAHGQMTPKQLDTIMNDFYDGKFDVLLSTTIVESGLDIPSANTIIIDRAHMLGLAQLYQLRGRVGRGKTRAYAYFTLPHNHLLTPMATKRLEVMQSLDTLGAGFTIASHDMDIRGFGNLLGEEQSGHVREVGVELYQQMLEEAVEAARRSQRGLPKLAESESSDWSPQINMGTSVLIPDDYVTDLALRLSLYRRVSTLQNEGDINSFAAELADRFGPVPPEVEHLLAIVNIKLLCKQAGVDKVDVGPNGAILSFRDNKFTQPEKLLQFISKNYRDMKLRGDHKLILIQKWDSPEKKLKGVTGSIAEIAKLAA